MERKDLPLHSAVLFAVSLDSALAEAARRGHPVERDVQTAFERFDKYETLVFDIDGVLQVGSAPLCGVGRALALLRARGKRIVFLTNTAGKSRQSCARQLCQAGIEAREEEVVTMAYAAACFLREQMPHVKVVFSVGSKALQEECARQGIEVVFADEEQRDTPQSPISSEEVSSGFAGIIRCTDDFAVYAKTRLRRDVGAVVLGYDERFSFHKLCVACLYAQLPPRPRGEKGDSSQEPPSPPAETPGGTGEEGLPLIATNKDLFNRVAGFRQPTNGSMVAAVEAALGREAKVIGKESDWLPEWLGRHLAFDFRRALVIGDRLDTDVVFAHKALADSCLVLSGCCTPQLLLDRGTQATPQPTFILAHLGLLAAEPSLSSAAASLECLSFHQTEVPTEAAAEEKGETARAAGVSRRP